MKRYETPYLYNEELLNLDIMAASEETEQFTNEDSTLNVHDIFGLAQS